MDSSGADADQAHRRSATMSFDYLMGDSPNGAGDIVVTHDLGHQVAARFAPKLVIVSFPASLDRP
jgi:hypothetical protein